MTNKNQENQLSKEYNVEETSMLVSQLTCYGAIKFIQKYKDVVEFKYGSINQVKIIPDNPKRMEYLAILECFYEFYYEDKGQIDFKDLKIRSEDQFEKRYIEFHEKWENNKSRL